MWYVFMIIEPTVVLNFKGYTFCGIILIFRLLLGLCM